MTALADILAKMRKVADSHASIGPSALRVYADRIEEEVKRALAKVEAEALSAGGLIEAMRHKRGNAAALRAALEKAELGLFRWLSGTMNRDEHRELVATIKEALAAPARNCDVPHKDGHELWVRWQNYCAEIFPSRVGFSRWLLAPAKKGGAK